MYHDMKKKPFFRHFLLTAALAGCISSGCLPEALSLCFPPFQEKDSPFSSFLLRTYAAEESTAADHSTEDISVSAESISRSSALAVTDFGIRLLNQTIASQNKEENILLSPLSVQCTLAMAANGACGETRAQMEQALGLPLDELNAALHACTAFPADNAVQFNLANSMWINENCLSALNPSFSQAASDWYDAEVHLSPFTPDTLFAINHWVSCRTNGLIPNFLSDINPDIGMYLLNALSFEGEWENEYSESQIQEGVFTAENGSSQNVTFMNSQEYAYLEDANASGFIKYYKGGAYAFAALLPKEGISLDQYISSLTGQDLQNLLSSPADIKVNASVPKFDIAFSATFSDELKNMGMELPLTSEADFSGIGTFTKGNFCISGVLHKTRMIVDERGTKAAAASATILLTGFPKQEEFKTVCLNRPFLCMIIDTQNRIPLFMGAVRTLDS